MGYKYSNEVVYFSTQKTFIGKKYFIENEDKRIVMSQIKKAEGKLNLKISAFVVLSNHYHILLKCLDWGLLRKSWQLINGGSSFLINKRHDVERSIWGEKFNWAVKNEKDFNRFLGYILGNPLKHGLVKSMEELREYEFSNYKDVVKEYSQEFIDGLIVLGQKFDLEEPNDWEEVYGKVLDEK